MMSVFRTFYLLRIENRPTDWDRLEKIYDPSGNYKKKYLEANHFEENKSSKK